MNVRMTRMRAQALAVVLAGTAMLGACSSGGSDEATKATETKTETSTTNDAKSFCDVFSALAAQREQTGGGGVRPGSTEAVPDTAEAWDRRIETTTELAAAAPADYQDEGAAYVELVKARAELFASHGYPASLAEIPVADTQAFINDHKDEQQQVNALIAFAKDECGVA